MSMYNDTVWREKGNKELCIASCVSESAKNWRIEGEKKRITRTEKRGCQATLTWKGETWRVLWTFRGRDPLERLDELSECGPVSCALVRVVPDVTDVPVSPCSVVSEFGDVLSLCSDREFCGTTVLFFLQKACTLLYKYARRDEIRRLTSESASDSEKKDDAAYTYAKFVHFL